MLNSISEIDSIDRKRCRKITLEPILLSQISKHSIGSSRLSDACDGVSLKSNLEHIFGKPRRQINILPIEFLFFGGCNKRVSIMGSQVSIDRGSDITLFVLIFDRSIATSDLRIDKIEHYTIRLDLFRVFVPQLCLLRRDESP